MKEIIAWVPAWRELDDLGRLEECHLPVVPGERVPEGYKVMAPFETQYTEVKK